MGERKRGQLRPEVMLGLTPGLLYLDKTGTDIALEDITKQKRVIYKKHDSFKDSKKVLRKPFKVGDNYIPSEIIINYDLYSEVDLARYVRIISIILSGFTGPKAADHLSNHVARLKMMLEKEKSQIAKEKAMKICLHAYEQHLGKRTGFHDLLKEEEYNRFIRVLNSLYNLYTIYDIKTISLSRKEAAVLSLRDMHDKRLLERLKNSKQRARLFKLLKDNQISKIGSEEELRLLIDLPEKRKELVDTINSWIINATDGKMDSLKRTLLMMYKDITDEQLVRKLKGDTTKKVLFDFLQRYDVYDVKSISELKSYVNKDDERSKLLKAMHEYYQKEWFPE
jgi:hypothetical protein